ncbi:MAG: hypothetical protein H6993_12335 [Pseudomonadales bacterium]|nr:hypothetical protein [Pseudomonadales bacterium]MCP5184746.1 hypothetical protein [Pseudomonadales bacterium]
MSQRALNSLLRLRRARVLQAQARVAASARQLDEIRKQVAEHEGLVSDYGLDRLGAAASPEAVLRNRRFAGKLLDVVDTRRRQASLLQHDLLRQEAAMRLAHRQQRSAELVLEKATAAQNLQAARKLRRRSIHRGDLSGRWENQQESD